MKNLLSLVLLAAASLSLGACIQSATEHLPDQRIAVVADPDHPGRSIAIPKKCPDWKQDIGDGLENQYFDHYGCAQNYNLAKMIVEPNDLVRGRVPSSADAATGVLSIERYRSDKKKELINPKEINSTTK